MTSCTIDDPILTELDLEPILVKLSKDEPHWSLDHACRVEKEYRRFLLLCKLEPKQTIVPSKAVDTMWHAHILDTAKYREDCERYFGRFLDHFPYLGMRGEEDQKIWVSAGLETLSLYETIFKKAAGSLWVGSQKCNPSCGPCGNPSHGPCGQPSKCQNMDHRQRPRLSA